MSDRPADQAPTSGDEAPPVTDTAAGDGRGTIARLAEHVLPTLIERLTTSSLGEIEVREDGWRVRLRRPTASSGHADAPPNARRTRRSGGSGGRGQEQRPAAQAGAAHVEPSQAERDRGTIVSPAVGYFAPRDGIAIGDSLRAGDVLGHVDVLGVRQDVVAPVDGALRALDAEPGQAVEYGQPLGRVEGGATTAGGDV